MTPTTIDPMVPPRPTILLEDNHCLLVSKPAGMLTQGDSSGDESLVDWVSAYWKQKYNKPGNVYIGLIHRLDRPTSGVVLLARTSKAAARLSDQFRRGEVEKTYFAVCDGRTLPRNGIWTDYLIKDAGTNTVVIARENQEGSQIARVEFQVGWQESGRVGVILTPRTGRGHQLRVQLASRGLPIVGDAKYGSRSQLLAADGLPRIALHAARLVFKHPTTGATCAVPAPLPPDWPAGVPAFETDWNHSSTPAARPDHSAPTP